MADLKISQLPAAAALTGAELIELVQSGANVKSTVTAVAAAAAAVAPIVSLGDAFAQQSVAYLIANATLSSFDVLRISTFPNQSGNAITWNLPAPATSLLRSFSNVTDPSSAALNSAAGFMNAQALASVYAGISSNANGGGFTTSYTLGSTGRSDMRAFWGMVPFNTPSINGAVDPSAALNVIGFGKDAADVNLQFMQNNGAGTATKTDLGVSMASLSGKALRLEIAVALGVAKYTLIILDTQQKITGSVSTKLPANDVALNPYAAVNTGPTTATSVVLTMVKTVIGANT